MREDEKPSTSRGHRPKPACGVNFINKCHQYSRLRGILLAAFAYSYSYICHGWQPASGRPRPLSMIHGGSSSTLNCNVRSSLETREKVWEHLLKTFQGDFDNYNQVVEDRSLGLLPREGGGHENFHCTLIPVSEHGRLAAFYFDGNPQRIFRFRYYEVLPFTERFVDDLGVGMKLYTLRPDLESLLREYSEDALQWPSLFSSFGNSSTLADKIDYLPNCEITWSFQMDPVQHSYISQENIETDGLHAVMVHGEAIVDSTLIPGIKIRILDQLSLYDGVFYINDRGLDPETGTFIYGNQKGVPYRLERVSRLVKGKRDLVDDDLKWTLGAAWRDDDEYKARIDAIGGPSIQMKAPKKKGNSGQ